MNSVTEKEALYTEYRDKVRGYVFGKLQNQSDAEDIISEIFLKIYKRYDSFDKDRASVSTWIYTITRNTVIDYFRSHRIHSELADSLSDNEYVDDNILKKESLAELGKALFKLDNRAQEIIILRYYKEMTLKDISSRMNVSYAYVKILHQKALCSLRALIGEDDC